MTFEEFFKKKRVDLDALQLGKPSLFSEFKTHFELMGEKSFDHTKKYWFNKIRREYPLPIETKTEKVKIDNPLAEQTITESLEANAVSTPKPGFTPRFKAASTPKPVIETTEENKPVDIAETAPAPKPSFTPRFKAANLPKPATEPTAETKSEELPEAAPAPKLGFTPKFKAASPPKPAETFAEENKITEEPEAKPDPKLGFTPKFKVVNIPKPKDVSKDPEAEKTEDTSATPTEESAPKPAYKPRFSMKNLPKKEEE